MSTVSLTNTQASTLTALSCKPSTPYAMMQTLKVEKALATNLLTQLVELGMAKLYGNGQFNITDAGKTHLKNLASPASMKLDQGAVFPVAPKSETSAKLAKQTVEIIDVDRPGEEPAEDLAALLDMTPAEQQEPDPVIVRAEAEATAIVTQIQQSKKALPAEIESSLLKLEKLLHVPTLTPMSDIDTKLQVLERLAALLHPTIADVLDAIADDLQRVQQVAIDVSEAA